MSLNNNNSSLTQAEKEKKIQELETSISSLETEIKALEEKAEKKREEIKNINE